MQMSRYLSIIIRAFFQRPVRPILTNMSITI